jgi:CheY-like chemotaxis protein
LARKILLADDSVTAQNMGRRILSDAGYEVTTVNNGSAALKRIAESKPDLIVLDVYMPGYGGLEVCQRLRESKETARIPVLLTVGKLEPFKPEEARRVRADAFIVKPFEASELLTALTKLEDRIVPQPAPYKPGRFAKAISALEADAQSNEYGDLESGWKNRLKIPVPQSHGQELEIEEQAEEQAKPAESRKPETPAQKPAEELAVVPRDITPEEIAAINAAAAAFGTQIVESTAEPEAVAASEPIAQAEESQPETVADSGDEVAATFATAATVEETQAEPERVETEQRSEPPAAEEVKAEVTEMATNAAPETQAEMPVTPTEDVAIAAPVEMQPVVEERDDFAAALASLTPANGNGVPAVQQFSGPRWTAELVAVTDAESALVLDREMEKAVAAMAAQAAETVQASDTAEASASSSVEERQQETDRTPAEEIAGRTAEDEAATSLVAAMMNQAAMPTLSDLVDSVLPRASDEAVTPESQGAAFAAAAAAGGDAVSPSVAPSEVPPSDAPPVAPSAGEAVERQRESELAAAWESWKHIRESVVEPQFKSPAADAAPETHAPEAEQVSSAQPASDDETSVQEEAGAIASIVDSVLADLKPRLMEEISKKMGKEKKRR